MHIDASHFGAYLPSAGAPLIVRVPADVTRVAPIVLTHVDADPALVAEISSHIIIDLSSIEQGAYVGSCSLTLQARPQRPQTSLPQTEPTITPEPELTPTPDPSITQPGDLPTAQPSPSPSVSTTAPVREPRGHHTSNESTARTASSTNTGAAQDRAAIPASDRSQLAVTGAHHDLWIPLIGLGAVAAGAIMLGCLSRHPKAGPRRAPPR